MQFLKTLFWVALAVILVLFGNANWHDVTLNLWGGLEADVKLPFLVLASFLLGFVPTYILYRARIWTLKRQLGRPDRVVVGNQPISNTPPVDPIAPSPPIATEPPPI